MSMPDRLLDDRLARAAKELQELEASLMHTRYPAEHPDFKDWHRRLGSLLVQEFYGIWPHTQFNAIRFNVSRRRQPLLGPVQVDDSEEMAERAATVFHRGVAGALRHLNDVRGNLRQIPRGSPYADRPRTQEGPGSSVINIDHMSNSQLQQRTDGSSQSTTVSADSTPALDLVLNELRAFAAGLDDDRRRQDLEAQTLTVQAQIGAPEPSKGIIREALGRAQSIVEAAAGGKHLIDALGELIR